MSGSSPWANAIAADFNSVLQRGDAVGDYMPPGQYYERPKYEPIEEYSNAEAAFDFVGIVAPILRAYRAVRGSTARRSTPNVPKPEYTITIPAPSYSNPSRMERIKEMAK